MNNTHDHFQIFWASLWLVIGFFIFGRAALAQSPPDDADIVFASPVETPPVSTPKAEPETRIHISPAQVQVYKGGLGTTDIQVDTPADLRTVELEIWFDPAIIAVVDADLDSAGDQISVDLRLIEAGVTVVSNDVDNGLGRIALSLSEIAPDLPLETLATITWLGRREGIAELSLAEVALTNHAGQLLAPDTGNSTIQVTLAASEPIIGRVLLQGRRQYEGTLIFTSPQPCDTLPGGFSELNTREPETRTDGDGYFEIVPVEEETFRCVQVGRRGYLLGQKTNPQGNLGTLTLPGGDINGDNVVNIFDLAYIGSRYGDNDPEVDINGDGSVNIFDLVLAASNFGLRGPVTTWR